MFTTIDKALVALAMSVLSILSFFGIGVPDWANEQTLGMIFGGLAPILTYLIPNKSA